MNTFEHLVSIGPTGLLSIGHPMEPIAIGAGPAGPCCPAAAQDGVSQFVDSSTSRDLLVKPLEEYPQGITGIIHVLGDGLDIPLGKHRLLNGVGPCKKYV
jgi:hypothetical protein